MDLKHIQWLRVWRQAERRKLKGPSSRSFSNSAIHLAVSRGRLAQAKLTHLSRYPFVMSHQSEPKLTDRLYRKPPNESTDGASPGYSWLLLVTRVTAEGRSVFITSWAGRRATVSTWNSGDANASAANAASWRYLERVVDLRVRERIAVEIWHSLQRVGADVPKTTKQNELQTKLELDTPATRLLPKRRSPTRREIDDTQPAGGVERCRWPDRRSGLVASGRSRVVRTRRQAEVQTRPLTSPDVNTPTVRDILITLLHFNCFFFIHFDDLLILD